jgi:hypothetical protein
VDIWWYNFAAMKLKFPKIPKLPRLNTRPVKIFFSFLFRHWLLTIGAVCLIMFLSGAVWFRNYLSSTIKPVIQSSTGIFYKASSNKTVPTIAVSPSVEKNSVPSETENTSDSIDYTSFNTPTPFPTFPPIPTAIPQTTTYTSSSSNSSSNSNCSTGGGVANAWYSDVYPNPPITTSNGSIDLTVVIRDCNKNTASVNDQLTISLNSGDPNTQINGNSLPYSVNAQNGQASFTVSSQVSGTVVLVVHDQTAGFDITNVNNSNPSIAFSVSNGSGNSHCTTASGVPNSWYSDVYPPGSVEAGQTATFRVNIRDCGQNDVSSDNLTISQTSSDASLTINGSTPPVNISVQNGVATFTVTSQNAGTDTLLVKDTTSGFTITDSSNSNPSITFTGSSMASTPTPTPTPDDTDTPTPTNL